eukprot:TRINITY_DN2959_c0_g1_i1.p1 TRINITY_DN2959_c0_g1~~TRINITY_DN2959_c0_g1_i1.p1  ORF type:complete len:231 (+),score=33.90 TRINITY_DN2959_c0_g1_i1:530-1222(+)
MAEIEMLRSFYNYAQEMEIIAPMLVTSLCGCCRRLSRYQRLTQTQQEIEDVKREARETMDSLARMMDFVLRFDKENNSNESISSYSYHRYIKRMKFTNKDSIRDEEFSRMSRFFASSTPMRNRLRETLVRLFMSSPKTATVMNSNDAPPTCITQDEITNTFAAITNACVSVVTKLNQQCNIYEGASTSRWLHTMTASILLFNYIHPRDASCKKSPISSSAPEPQRSGPIE